MIVICKKETKRILKGVRYEVIGLWNSGKNSRWLEGKIQIKDIGKYSVNNFTDLNGNPLPKIDIQPTLKNYTSLKFEDLKEGDILVCNSDNYKCLAKGAMYRVEKLELKTLSTHSGYKHQIGQVKFVGIERKLKYSSWRFRKLTTEESRDISLKSVFGEETTEVVTKKTRKIDLSANKNLDLVKNLAKSILDENRHHLSTIDWAIKKTGNHLSLDAEDYKELLKMKLEDVLKLVD